MLYVVIGSQFRLNRLVWICFRAPFWRPRVAATFCCPYWVGWPNPTLTQWSNLSVLSYHEIRHPSPLQGVVKEKRPRPPPSPCQSRSRMRLLYFQRWAIACQYVAIHLKSPNLRNTTHPLSVSIPIAAIGCKGKSCSGSPKSRNLRCFAPCSRFLGLREIHGIHAS